MSLPCSRIADWHFVQYESGKLHERKILIRTQAYRLLITRMAIDDRQRQKGYPKELEERPPQSPFAGFPSLFPIPDHINPFDFECPNTQLNGSYKLQVWGASTQPVSLLATSLA